MILASSRTGRGFNPRTVLLNLYDEKNTWVRVFFLLMQQSCLFAVNVCLESPKKIGRYSHRGSNSGPLACEASVITN